MLITSIVSGIICLIYAFVTDMRGDGLHTPTRAAVALGAGLAIVLAGITVAHAADFTFDQPKSDWSTGDTWREVGFQGLLAIDALQTHAIIHSQASCNLGQPNQIPDCHYHYEQNNYLGARPTVGAVNRYFLVGSVLHAGISYLLPEKYRSVWQYVTIGVEAGYVANNFSLGIGARF